MICCKIKGMGLVHLVVSNNDKLSRCHISTSSQRQPLTVQHICLTEIHAQNKIRLQIL